MKFIPLIWSGIWRKKGRTWVMLIQLILTFILFGLLQAVVAGIQQSVNRIPADLLVVYSRVQAGSRIPLSLRTQIAAIEGVREICVQNTLPATYQNARQKLSVLATDGNWISLSRVFVAPQEQIAALVRLRTGALVSEDLARKYGWKIGQNIQLESPILQENGAGAWSFDVVGMFKLRDGESDNTDFIVVNNDYVDGARRSFERGGVQAYYISVSDPSKAKMIAGAVDDLSMNSDHETKTESMRDKTAAQVESLGDLNFLVRIIVGSSLFALFVSTIALMAQGIGERRSELATLKALGFSDLLVFWLLVCESLAICIVSAAVGLSLANWMIVLARNLMSGNLMTANVVAAGMALSVLLAAAAAALPAWRGKTLRVAEALSRR